MKSACFTGHRYANISKELKNRLSIEIEQLIRNGVTEFYAGGALGFDTIAEKTVIALKKDHPSIKLNLVLPCPFEQQTLKWNDDEKEEFMSIIDIADNVEICNPSYTPTCMKERNKRLVDLADICVCYYNIKDRISGTGQTVRFAQEKGIPLINVFLD